MAECGPAPRIEDFTKKNGNVKWTAYNKAYKRWLLCMEPEVARARAEGTGAVVETIGEVGSGLLDAYMTSQGAGIGAGFAGADFNQPPQPPPQPEVELLKWAVPAAAGLALLAFLRR